MKKTLLMTTYLLTALSSINGEAALCPIGFQSCTNTSLCFRLKGPETFEERFNDCEGNRYSFSLLQNDPAMLQSFKDLKINFWTDYKSVDVGELVMDEIDGSPYLNVSTDYLYINEKKICIMVYYENDQLIYKDVTCFENIHRFCVVNSYMDPNLTFKHKSGCDNRFTRFTSPRSTCLAQMDVLKGPVRATWKQAQDMCKNHSAALLQKGWIYANNIHLSKNWTDEIPLGVFVSNGENIIWSEPDGYEREVPKTEHNIDLTNASAHSTFGSLKGGSWRVVNATKIFYNVICEKDADPKTPGLEVEFISRHNELEFKIININDFDSGMIIVDCKTDSENLPNDLYANYSTRTIFSEKDNGVFYKENPKNGYYYCYAYHRYLTQIKSEIKQYLYIKDIEDLKNVYAIKIKVRNKNYEFNNLHVMEKVWVNLLSEYMYLLTLSKIDFKEDNITEANKFSIQGKLKAFDDGKFSPDKVLIHHEIKKVFIDKKTAILHVEIKPNIKKLLPIPWGSIDVLSMRPVYLCPKTKDSTLDLYLHDSLPDVKNCKKQTCVGDYNQGVNLIEENVPECSPRQVEIPVTVLPTDPPSSEEDEVTDSLPPFTETLLPSTVTLPPTEPTTTLEPTTVEMPVTVTQPPPSPRPPQDQVDEVLDHLNNLLKQNPTEPISVANVNEAFDRVDNLLALEADVRIGGEFLTMLDSIGARADLNGTNNVTTVRGHVAMVVAMSEPNSPVRGLRVASRDEADFNDGSFHLLSERDNEDHLQSTINEAVVFLPESVALSERRISFVVFRDDRPFLASSEVNNVSVNSRIVSIRVEDIDQFHNGEVVNIHLKPITEDFDRNQTRSCGYWDFQPDGTGVWSQKGCTFIKAIKKGLLDTCRCTHLTHFAEVLVPRVQFPPRHEQALEYLSITGCSLSLFGLSIIGLTAVLFRTWRREFSNKIWLNLCVAICLLIVSFFVIVFARFEEYNLLCMFTGIVLHYSVVCSFCWMSIAAVISYKRLVQVFSREATHKLLRASAFAYGTPFLIVGVLLSVDPHAYLRQFQDTNPTGAFCYPTDLALWLTVYAPVVIMLVVNSTLFILIVRSVFAATQIQRHGDASDAFRCASVAFLLVFLFGLPWLFGLFAHLLLFSYLHTLTATFQGFVLFLFFIVGNKKTRELWMNKLKIKQTRKVPVSSTTGQRGQTVTIETNSTKPLSLGVDESRFS